MSRGDVTVGGSERIDYGIARRVVGPERLEDAQLQAESAMDRPRARCCGDWLSGQ